MLESKQDIPQNINFNDYVICEYLRGEEYTVDCLTDRNGRLLFISPRSRERILAGISVAGITKEVYEKCCIPVFDVDGIEVLLDWRS